MAGNSGRVTLGVGFNSDISGLNQPLQAIQKIRDSLKEIRTINIKIATAGKAPEEAAKLKKELLEAQDAAKIAGTALQKSFNTKLNTINVTSFNNELKKSNTNITELGQKLSKAGISGQAAFRNIVAQISKSHVTIKKTNALLDEMKTTMMNSVKWGITSSIWNNMTGSIEKAWGFAKKLDSSLNDIRIVTDKSAEDMEKFAVQANKAAKSLGSSTTGYTNASLIYYQQGLSDAEVQARTETTLKAANVTGQSAADVSEQLTAVWNGYKVSANEAELYIDKLSAVAATTAADLEELSTGMSKVASAANIMGVDIDQLNAQLATVVSVTRQAPESVGTAFKTIYARMGDIEAGLDTETSLGEYTKRMNEMGFNVLDTNGKLRDMGSVIEEIGNKWTSLSREQQVALSQTMAGTRQYNNLLALFDNWDEYTESLETSREAAGSLQKQQDIYMESMEAHLQQLSTEGERVYNNLFNADAVNPLIDALTGLVSIIGDAVGGLGGIGPIIMSLGAIFTQVFSKQIGSSITTTFLNMKNAKKDIAELKESITTLQKAGEGTTDQATKQIAKMGQDINNFALKGIITQEQADELQSYINKLDELKNIQEELEIQQEQYQGAVDGSIKKMEQSGIDKDVASAQFQKMEEQAEKDGTDYSELEGEELETALQKNEAYKEFTEIIEKQREKLDEAAKSADKYTEYLTKAENLGNSKEGTATGNKADEKLKNKTQELIKEIQTNDNASLKQNEALKAAIEKYQKRLQENGGKMSKEVREAAKEIATAYQTQVEEMTRNLDDATEAARRTAMGEGRDISQELQDVDAGRERVVDDYNEATSDINLEEKIGAITELVGAFGGLFAAINNIVNIIQVWNNEDLTGAEKLRQTITGLMVAIPIFVASLKAVDKGLISVAGKSLFGVGGLLAFKGAEDGAAASAIFLQGTLFPIIAIVAGVMAVLIAGVAIFNAVSDAYNADAIAAEKAAKAHEAATQAVNEAKTAYENLKNTIDKYNSAIEKLEDLAMGTDAFKEAMEEANSQAKELISTYGILSDQYFYNAQGAITFKEGVLDALEIQKKEQIAIAERQETIAKWESQKATAKSNKTDTVRAIQNDSGRYSALEDTGWEWLEVADRIIRGITTAGLSELALHVETNTGALGGFNESMLDEVVAAINANDAANGKLTDAVLDSLPYSQKQKDALKENSKSIEQSVASNKQLLDSQKNEFENLIRQSLQNNDTFNSMDAGSQNYLIKMILNQYGSYEEFQKQNNYDEILKSFEEQSIENLGSMYAKLKGQSGAKVEGDEVKLYNEQGQLTDITYTKEQMVAELASEQLLNGMSEIMLPFVAAVEDVSNKEANLLGRDTGLFSQYLATGKIDLTNMSSKEYSQLLKLLESGNGSLRTFFNSLDLSGTGFNSATEAMDSFVEQVKKTNFSSIFEKEQTKAAENVSQGNATIDKLLKGDSLDDKDLNLLTEMQKKYESLQGIWVEELWYNQENISKLKSALEVEEDIISASANAEAKWQEMNVAQERYNESMETFLGQQKESVSNQTDLDKIKKERIELEKYRLADSTLQSFKNLASNTAKSDGKTPQSQGAKYTSLAEDLNIFAQNENIDMGETKSIYVQDTLAVFATNVQNALNAGTDSISALNGAIETLTQDVQNTDQAISADAYAAKEAALNIVKQYSKEFTDYSKESDKFENANAELQKLDSEYENLSEKSKVSTEQTKEDLKEAYEELKKYEKSIQDALTMDLELRIANKEDLLTDVDNVIDRASNIKTAIESIGDGFKVAADKSDELLRIFPELAAGAKVLSDGTIELNELTVDNILDGEADILDADRNKTVTILQNRIKELDLSIEADKKQLEAVQNTAASEFDIQEYLNDTYKDFTSDEIKADTTQAQTEIANDGISTKAIINNWKQKSLAAAKYAEIAEKAISDPSSVSKEDVTESYKQYQANVKIDEDFSSVDSNLTDKEKEKQIAERNERLKKQFEDYLQQRIDLSEQERAEYLLAISDIYSSQNDIAATTQKNIDLLKDEIDRYHDINIQLDDIAKKIERINKAQEHLVGADWIAAQEQGLKLLEEEIKLRREKQKIQQAEAVELQGHLLADGVTFNEDGSVANYAEIMKQQIKKVTDAQKKAQTSGTDADKKAAEAVEKNYEKFKKNFERYEELRDDIEDLTDEITDMMYEQISKKIEVFKTKLEVKLDTTKAQKEWKEFTNQLFISANDALSQITKQSDLLKSDRSIASKATNKYDKIVNEGMKAQALVEGTAEKGTKSVYATYSKELGKYIFDQAKWQEDMEAAQQEAQDSILQIIDDVDSLGETAIGLLEDTIAAQKEQLAIYDDMNSLLNHAMKLQELFVGEEDYDSKAKMYEEQAKVAFEKTKTAKDRRQHTLDNIDSYAEAYKEAKQKYDKAKANGDGDVTVLEKQLEVTEQAYEDMKNELKESTEDFYTSIEEQIEIAKNAYINTINKAMADMENKMTGGKGLSYISDEWDLINKNADRYLDTVNSTYEVQSLEAKYRKAIDSTDNLSAQKKLNKAMEEELKALQEKDKLSQYDIDRANKKYEITMKQIALEEAQANKSSMRLRRDAQGNYSYQFVADENATAEAQQDLLAAQNELYNFDKERYQQTLDDALAAYQEYQQKMLEAAQINDPEKRAEMEKLITEQYQEYLLAITADNEVAKQNLQNSTMEALQGMYDVNSENFDIMTKGMFEDFKDADGNIKIDFQNLTETELSALMSNLVTGWDGSVQSMIDKIADPGPDGFKAQSKLVFETAQTAAKTLDDTLTTLGDNFSGEGNTADKILDDVTEINDKMNAFKKDVLDPTVDKGKEELPDAWAAYKTGVEKAAEAINTLIGKLMGAYTNASNLAEKLRDIASQSPINVDVNYNTTGDATTPSGNNTYNVGKIIGGGTETEKEDPWIGKTIIWKGEIRPFHYRYGNGEKKYFSDPQIYGESYQYGNGKMAGEQNRNPSSISWEIVADAQVINSKNQPGYQVKNLKTGMTGFIDKEDISKFDTGGYTGEWGAEGRMAMLHEKEIVLNKQDTTNILNAVSIVRGIGDLINNLSANLLGSLSQRTIDSTLGMRDFEQNVHITAEFPNVSSSSEIEDALRNLTNVAAQRAFNTRI